MTLIVQREQLLTRDTVSVTGHQIPQVPVVTNLDLKDQRREAVPLDLKEDHQDLSLHQREEDPSDQDLKRDQRVVPQSIVLPLLRRRVDQRDLFLLLLLNQDPEAQKDPLRKQQKDRNRNQRVDLKEDQMYLLLHPKENVNRILHRREDLHQKDNKKNKKPKEVQRKKLRDNSQEGKFLLLHLKEGNHRMMMMDSEKKRLPS